MVDKSGVFLAGIRTGAFRIRCRIAKQSYATFRQQYARSFTPTPLFHGTAAQLHALQCLTLYSSVRSCRGDGLPFLLFAVSELAASQTQSVNRMLIEHKASLSLEPERVAQGSE
jgi:hypothetical protein